MFSIESKTLESEHDYVAQVEKERLGRTKN